MSFSLTYPREVFARAAPQWPELDAALQSNSLGTVIRIELDAAPPAMAMGTLRKTSHGPGTELKRLLERAGLAAGGCQCDARAAEMDARGCAWCAHNVWVICGWLAEEATKRKLPFSKTAAYLLVMAAIAAARRKAGVDTPADAE